MATINDLKELFAERDELSIASEVYGFTSFRTTRMEELTQEEIDALVKVHSPEKLDEQFNALIEELKMKEWRSKILALAEREGIKEPNSFQKFNNWMLLNSKFKKQLSYHSLKELQELHRQLCALRDNNKRSATKPLTKAWERKANQNINWN